MMGLSSPKHFILPVIASASSTTAALMRMTRTTMLEVIRQDYIRTARAKGVPEKMVIRKHALKNALIPVVTVIGLQFGSLLGRRDSYRDRICMAWRWPSPGRLHQE